MPVDDILLDCEEHMEKSVEHLKHELRGVRTGRASPALVENIRVDYYGSMTEIRSIAAISVPEATQILIKPFNAHDLKAIEKAINDAKLPLTPHSDANKLVDTEEKGGVIAEDDARRGRDQIQELTKQYEAKVDEMIEHKKQEIL